MWWLLLVAPLVALFVYVLIYACDRDDARCKADEIIIGISSCTSKRINECIRRLATANRRLLSKNEVDLGRIKRLREIQDEMAAPRPWHAPNVPDIP